MSNLFGRHLWMMLMCRALYIRCQRSELPADCLAGRDRSHHHIIPAGVRSLPCRASLPTIQRHRQRSRNLVGPYVLSMPFLPSVIQNVISRNCSCNNCRRCVCPSQRPSNSKPDCRVWGLVMKRNWGQCLGQLRFLPSVGWYNMVQYVLLVLAKCY